MRRWIEVGAVLLWLVGCGTGEELQSEEPSSKPQLVPANADAPNPNCPEGT
jgi:hypothetical protein